MSQISSYTVSVTGTCVGLKFDWLTWLFMRLEQHAERILQDVARTNHTDAWKRLDAGIVERSVVVGSRAKSLTVAITWCESCPSSSSFQSRLAGMRRNDRQEWKGGAFLELARLRASNTRITWPVHMEAGLWSRQVTNQWCLIGRWRRYRIGLPPSHLVNNCSWSLSIYDD